jgi:hypothetical protein
VTAEQLAAALTDEKLDEMMEISSESERANWGWSGCRDSLRDAITNLLRPLLTGTCATCRHWQTRVVQTYEGKACALDAYGPNQPDGYACNNWQAKEPEC